MDLEKGAGKKIRITIFCNSTFLTVSLSLGSCFHPLTYMKCFTMRHQWRLQPLSHRGLYILFHTKDIIANPHNGLEEFVWITIISNCNGEMKTSESTWNIAIHSSQFFIVSALGGNALGGLKRRLRIIFMG